MSVGRNPYRLPGVATSPNSVRPTAFVPTYNRYPFRSRIRVANENAMTGHVAESMSLMSSLKSADRPCSSPPFVALAVNKKTHPSACAYPPELVPLQGWLEKESMVKSHPRERWGAYPDSAVSSS